MGCCLFLPCPSLLFEGLPDVGVKVIQKLWRTIFEFLYDVRGELKKVSYPTKAETIGSTTVVLVFCIIVSVYLSFADSLLVWLISKIL